MIVENGGFSIRYISRFFIILNENSRLGRVYMGNFFLDVFESVFMKFRIGGKKSNNTERTIINRYLRNILK
jgi:hypothetical protein